jgi:hypothetical protein
VSQGSVSQHLPSKDSTKFTQMGIFGFENIPSGNPDSVIRFILIRAAFFENSRKNAFVQQQLQNPGKNCE